jgi:hypothetical protein
MSLSSPLFYNKSIAIFFFYDIPIFKKRPSFVDFSGKFLILGIHDVSLGLDWDLFSYLEYYPSDAVTF